MEWFWVGLAIGALIVVGGIIWFVHRGPDEYN